MKTKLDEAVEAWRALCQQSISIHSGGRLSGREGPFWARTFKATFAKGPPAARDWKLSRPATDDDLARLLRELDGRDRKVGALALAALQASLAAGFQVTLLSWDHEESVTFYRMDPETTYETNRINVDAWSFDSEGVTFSASIEETYWERD